MTDEKTTPAKPAAPKRTMKDLMQENTELRDQIESLELDIRQLKAIKEVATVIPDTAVLTEDTMNKVEAALYGAGLMKIEVTNITSHLLAAGILFRERAETE